MEVTLEEDIRKEALMDVAKKMMLAARTAPKAKGIDNLIISVAGRETIEKIANKMKEMVEEGSSPGFFQRDANNILQTDVLVLIGTKIKPVGVQCGLCGYADCKEKAKHPDQACVFNTGDLGIAVGSAVSIASNARVDNRIMYSVGKTAIELNLLGSDVKIVYGIPLSATSKSPFFDR